MIQDLVNIGSIWKVLPPGVHSAILKEVKDFFATTIYRRHLFSGFERAINSLRIADCKTVFLDGSFITEKPIPGDYDVCWDTTGVDINLLDPVFLNFSDNRKEQKKKYYGEFFPANNLADGTAPFIDFFQIDKFTGKQKGIIKIDL